MNNDTFTDQDEPGRVDTTKAPLSLKELAEIAFFMPRDDKLVRKKLRELASDPEIAKRATYPVRGNDEDEEERRAPSINAARPLKEALGNIYTGVRIVSMNQDGGTLAGWAFDAQSRTFDERQESFSRWVKVKKRDGTSKMIRLDGRALRARVGATGSILERQAMLNVFPAKHVCYFLEECEKTEERELEGAPLVAIEDVIRAFAALGVGSARLAAHLGHEPASANDARELRGILNSIAEGVTTAEHWFGAAAQEGEPVSAPTGDVVSQMLASHVDQPSITTVPLPSRGIRDPDDDSQWAEPS